MGEGNWDIESAFRCYYAKGSPMAALQACNLDGAWSSQSAKLRNSEVQCQICVSEFQAGRETVVTQCCFQPICEECVANLKDADGVLRCPFCRGSSVAAVDSTSDAASVMRDFADRC